MKDKLTKEENWLLSEKYNGLIDESFLKDVERLKAGEPLDYVIGFTPFLGCHIDLSHKPLIPRTETEFWVEGVIKTILKKNNNKQISILDIFSGSGCIGVALLKHLPNAKVDFAEIDPNLSKQIQLNLKINKVPEDRFNTITTNVFRNVPNTYDYIFANPPYISSNLKSQADESVRKWEPSIALFSDKDGYEHINKLLNGIPDHLNKDGEVYIEFDTRQKESLEAQLKRKQFTAVFNKDQFGLWRTVSLKKTIHILTSNNT